MENNFASWNKGQQVWQMVSKLGRASQDREGHRSEFIHHGDFVKNTSATSVEWPVFEKIPTKSMVRCLNVK